MKTNNHQKIRRWSTLSIALIAICIPILFYANNLDAKFYQENRDISKNKKSETEIKKAIQKVLDDQTAAWNRGDLDEFMKGYAKSETLTFFSGQQKQNGWQATMNRYKKRYQGEGKEMGKVTFSDLQIIPLSDNFALVKGAWSLQQKKENPHGLFTLIFANQDGNWRIIHDHTSN